MKRLFILAVVGLLLGGTALFADESVLIDFTKLGADQTVGTNKTPSENAATMIDYSAVAGASFSDADKALMKSSLALDNWQVTLASSSRSIVNQSVTMTKEAVTNANAKQFNGEDMANKKILGVRIHFPTDRTTPGRSSSPRSISPPTRTRTRCRAGNWSWRTRTRARERSSTATAS